MVSFKLLFFRAVFLMVNGFFDLYTGGRRRPVFFDAFGTRPELPDLERHFAVIREELSGIMPRMDRIPRYHELDSTQHDISAEVQPDKAWRVFMLYAMGEKPVSERKQCPQTAALLDQIPGLFQAFFSILEGGKNIPAHRGPYRGYLRYHLGLIVPKTAPPSIRIKDQHYTWQEGRGILFDDSWEHEVFNQAQEMRVIIVVDILRPMPIPFARRW